MQMTAKSWHFVGEATVHGNPDAAGGTRSESASVSTDRERVRRLFFALVTAMLFAFSALPMSVLS